ncbi:holo-ACP synthase [Pelagicoccus sp. SDUM812003]|uniref:holo-ACP synthase n=1 Tax=Pelagicoccus sp. SDUM812003 TaxID=3041267 RepID=UPI00280D8CBA|nr:holo-ACP synthase [Pelagicoccus sp. SDUM812003]MDQ8204819.1 holo-ACP synthase [Pelagicoccus sp. SDUM812003]
MDAISLPCKGPVLGIGVDIVSVKRIRDLIDRQGDRFLHRVYTKAEREYCLKYKDPGERFAARFAAKEAVAKAFTTGIGEHLTWTSVSVVPGERGEPLVELDEKGRHLLHQVRGKYVAISLSHTDETAIAFATILG